MNLTIGFVSQNLVTEMNIIEFRDNRIFTFFWVMGVQGQDCLQKSKKLINDLS